MSPSTCLSSFISAASFVSLLPVKKWSICIAMFRIGSLLTMYLQNAPLCCV
jgi:hypothetical protein